MGDLRKSLELLNHSLEIDTDSAMAWRLRGQVNSLLGDYSEAINNLKKSKAVEDSSDIRIDLARAYNRAGRTTEAISEVTLAIKEGQAPLSARTMLETLYKDAGRKSDLKKFYRVTIEKYPDEVFWYFRAGVFYSEEQEYDTAAKLFEQSWEISQKTTANAECLNKYLDTLWMSGKYQDLMSYASQYIDTPFAPIAYAQMAKTEVKLNNLQTAKQHYYKALDKSASNPALLSGILDNMTKTLGAEEVEKYCDQKLAVEPDSLVANLTMFNLSQQTGQFNKALGYVDKLLKVVGPENPSWLLYTARRADTLVLAYMKTSDRQYMDQAVEAYEALLVKVPNNATALNNLAYLLADADDQLDKAAQYARRACQASPNDASKLDTYAYILCKTEKYEEAEKLLQTAIQLFEKSSTVIPWDIYEHLGMAQEGLGQKSKAVASYRRSLQIAGDEVSPKDRQELLDAIKRVSL
jgi:tetratricopeptide (TPR) repeat protein